jgi:hypothetical protein
MTERTSAPPSIKRYPKFEKGWPEWWNYNGAKMVLRSERSTEWSCVIANAAAEVIVVRNPLTGWEIDWEIKFEWPSFAKGQVNLGYYELRGAFGLENEVPGDSEWLVLRYGANSVIHGKYIRFERWLNIPGPGTGDDGDPNVSIEIDETILMAVNCLYLHNPPYPQETVVR